MLRRSAIQSSPSSTHSEEIDEEEEEEEKIIEDAECIWTFRVLFLGSFSCIFMFVVNKFFIHSNEDCIMSMISISTILYPICLIWAKFLPKTIFYLRIISISSFGLEFCLNPGPFDIREFALISIFANSGAAYGSITTKQP